MNTITADEYKRLARTNQSEAEFLRDVIAMARQCGWLVAHFRPGRTATGWRTAVQGDGKGFPDLVMVREDRVIYAELKSQTGQPTADQRRWRNHLIAAGQCWHLWRPRDWNAIVEVLT